MKQKLRTTTIFRDPTPNSFIMQRYLSAFARIAKEHTDFSIEEFDNFVLELTLLSWKLSATWRHLNTYIAIEEQLIEVERPKPSVETLDQQHIEYSQELYYELDGFLVQSKSTLDYLAKLPRAIVGKSWPQIHFGNKGNRVLRAVHNNLPAKYANITPLIEMCIKEHQGWLEMAIEARDRINHYIAGGLEISACMVAKTTVDGKETILVPMWLDDLTVRAYLEVLWNNLYVLVEQFTIGFLRARFKNGLGFISNPQPAGSPVSPILVLPDNAVEPTFRMLDYLNQKRATG